MNDDTDGRNKAITGVHGQCFVKDRQASCVCHGGLCCGLHLPRRALAGNPPMAVLEPASLRMQ